MIVFVLSTLIISFGIKILLKIKEEEAIFISVFGVVLLGYVCGLLNILKFVIYLIPVLSIVSLIYVIINLRNKKVEIKELFTLPILVYLLCATSLMIISNFYEFFDYDEYFFWGTNLKVMCIKDLLWAHKSIDGCHLVYPPFTAIAEYIVCKFNGGYSEQAASFGMAFLIITAIMPIFKDEKDTIKTFAKSIMAFAFLYISIMLLQYTMMTLTVDCILGVIFGMAMYHAYILKDKKDYIILIIFLITLTLIKTNGILFAGIVIMQRFFIELFSANKKDILKRIGIIVLLLIIIMASYGIWKLYCDFNGKYLDIRHDMNTPENIDITEFYLDITMSNQANTRNKQIVQNFWKKLNTYLVINKIHFNTAISVVIAVNVILGLTIIFKKEKLKTLSSIISFDIGFILYCLTLLVVFIFVFHSYQGDVQMGYARYIQTYLLAMILFSVFIILKDLNKKSGLILSLMFVAIAWGLNVNPIKENEYYKTTGSTLDQSKQILNNISESDKIYLIDQRTNNGIEVMKIRYLIAPVKTNLLYEWKPVTKQNKDRTAQIITAEEWISRLIEENYEYVFLMYVDKKFIADYKEILPESLVQTFNENTEAAKKYIELNGFLLKVDKENRILSNSIK